MKPKLKPLGEQVVVITGASSGIGLLTAKGAARAGAKVLLIARNRGALEAIQQKIALDGGVAEIAIADVGDATAVEAAARRAIECFGRIDTWVNNAGVAIYAKLVDTPDDEHARLFDTNYFGVVHGCRTAVRHMQCDGGALISIGSIASDMPSPILGAYAASKHAIKAYVESLRIELRADGIPLSVTLIKPSGMATPIAIHSANHLAGEALVPPPPYDPQLVADAVLFCAQYARRDVTVGGIGRAQTLFAQHFPAVFERLAPLVVPFLTSKGLPNTQGDSLQSPGRDGQARSPHEQGITISPYTSLTLRPMVKTVMIAGGMALLTALAWRKRR